MQKVVKKYARNTGQIRTLPLYLHDEDGTILKDEDGKALYEQ